MISKRLILACALSICALFASAQVDPNRTVITVNGEDIKGAEYYERMEFLPGLGYLAGEGEQRRFTELAPGVATLQRLIEERLILQIAKERGVAVSDADLEVAYQERAKEIPNFEASYQEAGLSKAFILRQMKLELSQFRIVTQGINITDQQVEQFYTDQSYRYTTPKRYRLGLLVCKPEDQAKADADFAAKKPFTEIVKKYSQDPLTKDRGGDMGEVTEEELSPGTLAAIKKIKIGQTTEWVVGEGVAVKFNLVNVIPESKRPLDPALKKVIRKELMYNKGVNKNDLEQLLREARKKAKIELKQPHFKNEINRILDKYKLG